MGLCIYIIPDAERFKVSVPLVLYKAPLIDTLYFHTMESQFPYSRDHDFLVCSLDCQENAGKADTLQVRAI